MKPKLLSIAEVETIFLESPSSDTAVVFLHGYGANMHDLFPLWELWHQHDFNWYFPNGVQGLPMGYYEGRSWFSIDLERLETAIREGRHREMRGDTPAELHETLHRLELFFLELQKKHKRLIIGGFSQGAMCASHLILRPNLNFAGAVLLSGALLAEDKFPKSAKAIPFYQSHGSGDPILSLDGAKDLEAKLKSLNFPGSLHVFRGGHEIPPSVINEVKNFLSQFGPSEK